MEASPRSLFSGKALLFVRFGSVIFLLILLTLVIGALRHMGGTQPCFLTSIWVSDLLQNFMKMDSLPSILDTIFFSCNSDRFINPQSFIRQTFECYKPSMFLGSGIVAGTQRTKS